MLPCYTRFLYPHSQSSGVGRLVPTSQNLNVSRHLPKVMGILSVRKPEFGPGLRGHRTSALNHLGSPGVGGILRPTARRVLTGKVAQAGSESRVQVCPPLPAVLSISERPSCPGGPGMHRTQGERFH